jgi:hypothetical protein
MKLSLACTTVVSLLCLASEVTSFAGLPPTARIFRQQQRLSGVLFAEGSEGEVVDVDLIKFDSDEEKKAAVGNLIANDEWLGLGMELSETIRLAVTEDLKKNAKDFLGKEDYKVSRREELILDRSL